MDAAAERIIWGWSGALPTEAVHSLRMQTPRRGPRKSLYTPVEIILPNIVTQGSHFVAERGAAADGMWQ